MSARVSSLPAALSYFAQSRCASRGESKSSAAVMAEMGYGANQEQSAAFDTAG